MGFEFVSVLAIIFACVLGLYLLIFQIMGLRVINSNEVAVVEK